MGSRTVGDLLLGLGIGWAAGIAPGPLSVLVVTSAIQRGFGAGARIAVAPLLTDGPIVALGVLLATGVPGEVVDALSVAGGIYLVWLGLSEIRHADSPQSAVSVAGDLRRGVVANLLSPHPWLFWFTVGGPRAVEAWQRSPSGAVWFIVAFFVALVGTKLVFAAIAAGTGHRIDPTWRRRLARAGGVALVVLGVLLAVDVV